MTSTSSSAPVKKSHGLLRSVALLEIVLFYLFLFVLAWVIGNDSRFLEVVPHPAWIIILLVAVQYGTAEGLLAALAGIAFLYLGNLPQQMFAETSYDYYIRLAWQPLAWLTTAVVIGEMRVHQRRENKELHNQLIDAKIEAETITEAYARLRDIKDNLEIQIASQRQQAFDACQAMTAVAFVKREEVLTFFTEVVAAAVKPQSFSIYQVEDNHARCVGWRGWETKDSYPHFINATDPIFAAVVLQKRTLDIANSEDEKILGNQGMIVVPIEDKDGTIHGFVKIEHLPFIEVSKTTVELLHILCEWITTVLSAATVREKA